jgi:hypothetical protein
VIYDLLFKASSETTLTIAADCRYEGTLLGFCETRPKRSAFGVV